MKTTKSLSALTALALLLGVGGQAQAAFMFTIERVSDTFAIITGSGVTDGGDNDIIFDFVIEPFAGSQFNAPFVANGFQVGAFPLLNVAVNTGGFMDFQFGTTNFGAGAVLSGGPVEVTLTSGTWKPVGSTDRALNSTTDGTWEMVAAVPVPGAAWLVSAGLFGLAAVRRRRQCSPL